MVQFQNVMCDGDQKTFCGNIPYPTQQKPAEIQVFLRVSKDTLRLDGAVHTQQDPLLCGYLFLHFFPLFCKIFGHFQPLDPIFQWSFTALALPNALLLTGTVLTVVTLINRFFNRKIPAGLSLLDLCYAKLPALGTGISILLAIILHVFPAANIHFIFACLPPPMIGWLYK